MREKTRYPGVWSLGNGRYEIRAYATNSKTGRPAEAWRTISAKDAQAAAAQREQLRGELRRDRAAAPARQTLRRYALSWLAAKAPRLTAATQKTYGEAVTAILGGLGDLFCDAVELSDLVAWRDAQARLLVRKGSRVNAAGEREPILRPIAAPTVNGRLRVLRKVVGDMTHDLRLPRNPCDRLESLPEPKRVEDEEAWALTSDELRAVLEKLREQSPQWYPLVLLLALTGVRWGEATALRWDDVDLDARTLRLRRSHWRGRVGAPKTTASRRIVSLAPELAESLKTHRQEQLRTQAPGLDVGLVFPSRRGTHRTSGVLTKPVRKALRAAGVTRAFPASKGFRHTLNNLVRQVADEHARQAVLGHATTEMGSRYSHVRVDERHQIIGRVVSMVRGPDRGPGSAET